MQDHDLFSGHLKSSLVKTAVPHTFTTKINASSKLLLKLSTVSHGLHQGILLSCNGNGLVDMEAQQLFKFHTFSRLLVHVGFKLRHYLDGQDQTFKLMRTT